MISSHPSAKDTLSLNDENIISPHISVKIEENEDAPFGYDIVALMVQN